MAKLFKQCGYAVIESITRADTPEAAAADNWERRLEAVGFEGALEIYVSEKKMPGKKFAYLYDAIHNWWRTSLGEVEFADGKVIVSTACSIYVFRLISNKELEQRHFETVMRNTASMCENTAAANFKSIEGYRDLLVSQLRLLDSVRPEDEDSEDFESWAELHEELEDLIDDIMDKLDEIAQK